jgi:phosphoribosylanthranilate isomerase
MRTRVKVCCIQSYEEAKLAIELGADCLGLVGEMPSGPGPISDAAIAEIAAAVPPGVSTFLLTSRTEPDSVVEHVRLAGTQVVQLVDTVPKKTYRTLREACPSVRIVQVVHVQDESAVEVASQTAVHVDAILLDSGRPRAQVRELGGTGRTHDWRVSKRVVESVSVPVFLAGGLAPWNVGHAIRSVSPFGVDLCSSVRTEGALEGERLADFLEAVRRADAGGQAI